MQLEDGSVTWICAHCRAQHSTVEDPAELAWLRPAEEPCPLCRTALHHAALAGTSLLACPTCRGLLVSMEIFPGIAGRLRLLAELPETASPRPSPGELERRLTCPRCARSMNTHYYGGPGSIVIDSCSPCELNWLDAGELTRVASAYQQRREVL